MAPAGPHDGPPALPWGAVEAAPRAGSPAGPAQAELLTDAERAAAAPGSVQPGLQLEVLWELDEPPGACVVSGCCGARPACRAQPG